MTPLLLGNRNASQPIVFDNFFNPRKEGMSSVYDNQTL